MSELRVDNIVSEDGSSGPVYSKELTIAVGQTLTCSGDFSVSGDVDFNSGATVTGVVTFTSADLQTNLSVNPSLNVASNIQLGSAGIVTSKGVYILITPLKQWQLEQPIRMVLLIMLFLSVI